MDLTGVSWRKSSYSAGNGGDCVEVAEVWRKSSYSGNHLGSTWNESNRRSAFIGTFAL